MKTLQPLKPEIPRDAIARLCEEYYACKAIPLLALALVRLVEILGEAAKNVSETTRNRTPEIPWRPIAGTRDRLTHAYFEVNLDILWEIVTGDLPVVLPQLEALLETLDP